MSIGTSRPDLEHLFVLVRMALTAPATVDDVGCLIAAFLTLAVAFAGVGFVAHVLWVVAAIFFVCWVAGYAFARGKRRGSRARRWG